MVAKYWDSLPQLAADLLMTDGGIETTLIFYEGFNLPYKGLKVNSILAFVT